MELKKFDLVWRIALTIGLGIGMLIVYSQFKEIQKEGLLCQSNPLLYGSQKLIEATDNDHIDCKCSLYIDGGLKKSYDFNENGRVLPSNIGYKLKFTPEQIKELTTVN